ncbi:hypothetical protein B0H13DRAFT_2365926 [Mycena leptocephala]|nr:hypothetical protein B0H13DRAFT_2365926 [Mycena leptocephala]
MHLPPCFRTAPNVSVPVHLHDANWSVQPHDTNLRRHSADAPPDTAYEDAHPQYADANALPMRNANVAAAQCGCPTRSSAILDNPAPIPPAAQHAPVANVNVPVQPRTIKRPGGAVQTMLPSPVQCYGLPATTERNHAAQRYATPTADDKCKHLANCNRAARKRAVQCRSFLCPPPLPMNANTQHRELQTRPGGPMRTLLAVFMAAPCGRERSRTTSARGLRRDAGIGGALSPVRCCYQTGFPPAPNWFCASPAGDFTVY